MEDNKYYTPSLREFYLDFEYEKRSFNSDKWVWFKKEFTTDKDWLELDEEIDDGDVRVKYLDGDDLISFGWKKEANEMFSMVHDFSANDYFIEKQDEKWSIYVQQYAMDYTGNNDVIALFYGTIKNKSELRRIMEMVGINTK